ncbi:glutaredoxin, partial [Vibrio sp. 10N.222.49.E5]
FCVEPSITWPPALERWLEHQSQTLKLSLLR